MNPASTTLSTAEQTHRDGDFEVPLLEQQGLTTLLTPEGLPIHERGFPVDTSPLLGKPADYGADVGRKPHAIEIPGVGIYRIVRIPGRVFLIRDLGFPNPEKYEVSTPEAFLERLDDLTRTPHGAKREFVIHYD